VALDEIGRIAVPPEQLFQLVVAYPGEDAWIGNLVAVEMEDRQDRTVRGGVQELVRMPARGERSSLGFSVTDHAGHHQVGIVECRAISVRQGVTQLAAFMDRTRCFRGYMTWHSARG